jgi:hypothetical protein
MHFKGEKLKQMKNYDKLKENGQEGAMMQGSGQAGNIQR